MKLLIVESPTKAKTLSKYLTGFKVVASMGHIIDLPAKKLGVDIENGFTPNYEVIPGKEKIIAQLKKDAEKAEEIYIGADPDREGEAIAYHIASLFEGRDVKRVLFHEITKTGVIKALQEFVTLNDNLYNSQQARRILDRVVGYKLSPFLWRSIKKGLSAGRVQSVALQMVVNREKDIRAFVPDEYWTMKGQFNGKLGELEGLLDKISGKKAEIKNEKQAGELKKALEAAKAYKVVSIEKKKRTESPLPPLNTSNLQQEASKLHNYTAEKIMRVAQSLYEGKDLGEEGATGLITYMRTDSFRISESANKSCREFISGTYGKEYLSAKTRFFKNKKGKTQDAHEAIRPTNVALTPDRVARFLTKEELNVYSIIWRRFIATQMKEALYDGTTVTISDETGKYAFKKTGSVQVFDGYRKVYKRSGKDEIIPAYEKDDEFKLDAVVDEQHFTKPSSRFTEGSLVKELEEKGVGRPSTYAAIIRQIVLRNYVQRMKEPRGALQSTDLGELVSDTLSSFFSDIININFTAKMEEDLDLIEDGQKNWLEIVENFYGSFAKSLDESITKVKKDGKQRIYAEDPCPKCGKKLVLRWSKKGNQPFLSCSEYPECDFAGSFEKVDGKIKLIESEPVEKQLLDEKCPKCDSPLVMKKGRYGEFKACSAYPKCKTIIREEKVVGVCPKEDCDGNVVEKRSKRGKLFYGCSKYPECDFVSWYPPVEGGKCEKCGCTYVVEKKRSGKVCQICGHKQA